MTKRLSCLLALLLPLALCPSRTGAADIASLERFLDETSLAILTLDLEKADPEAALTLLTGAVRASTLSPEDQQQLINALSEQHLPQLRQQREAILAAGAKTIFIVFSLSYLPDAPLIQVIPLTDGMDAGRIPGERIGNVKVLAPPPLIERVKTLHSTPRPQFREATAGGSGAAFELIIAPSDQSRRVYGEMVPALPAELGGSSTRPLADGLRWIKVTVHLAPEASARAEIVATNPAAAEQINEIVQRILQSPALQAFNLAPEVADDRSVIELKGQRLQDSLAPLTTLIAKARAEALAQESASNLRQLGLAMLLYANERQGQFPATLKEAVESENVAHQVLINPRSPQREHGYTYIRPDLPEKQFPGTRDVLAYESFDGWPASGVMVLFGDGHTELITDEAAFRGMVEQTQHRHRQAREAAERP